MDLLASAVGGVLAGLFSIAAKALIDHFLGKKRQLYSERFSRATYAAKLLDDKVFSFLEATDEVVAKLVPLILDIEEYICGYGYSQGESGSPHASKPRFELDKEDFSSYFPAIVELKHLTIAYDIYLDDELKNLYGGLIAHMQGSMEMLLKGYELARDDRRDEIDREAVAKACDMEIMIIAAARLQAKNYLERLAGRGGGNKRPRGADEDEPGTGIH